MPWKNIEGTEMPLILWHGDAKARRCLYIYIYIRNQHGTGMPDFWPIQLETGALPNVPFPPITLVFICLPTSRKLLTICNRSSFTNVEINFKLCFCI